MNIENLIISLLAIGGLSLAIAIEMNRRAIRQLKNWMLLVEKEG